MDRFCIENNKEIFIINADDLGYNEKIDQGIFELIKTGQIKSVSVMVNGSNIQQVVEKVHQLRKEDPEIFIQCSFGLHFNLTEGKPLNYKLIGSQIAPEGQFIGKQKFYQVIEGINQDVVGCIEEEVRMQLISFLQMFERRASHLDGHNHVHLVPKIASGIAKVMTEMGIYRVRGLEEELESVTLPMNHVFLKNYHSSKGLFQNEHILWPNIFVGLQSFGKLTSKSIQKSFQRQKECYKSVELMCHPGFPDENGVPWIASPDRLQQLKQLQSVQFNLLRKKFQISSYLDLKSNDESQKRKFLIYSKLDKGTGNYTTTLRFRQMFRNMGFEVYLWNASDQLDLESESSDLFKFLLNFGISVIIGVNASRSAEIINKATRKLKVPYFLVIAGTDANITFKNDQSLKRIEKALEDSECLISLSDAMAEITKEVVNKLKLRKEVHKITQSSCISQICAKKEEEGWVKPVRQYILFPTSFRKVKCVHHILKELNAVVEDFNVDVLVAGPILDQQYYQECIAQFKKVKYLGVVSKQMYSIYLKNCFAVINTSESEGMSCSILQAFEMKKPVIARKNTGNQELVKHYVNGFIYEHPHQFLDIFRKLLEDQELRVKFTNKSYSLFTEQYGYKKEYEKYKNLIQKYFINNISTYKVKNSTINIFNKISTHPTSDINVERFNQIEHKFYPNNKIIDLGCGTGIFGIVVLTNNEVQNIELWINDIHLDIVAHALYNIRQNDIWKKISQVYGVQSNWFDKLDKKQVFDVILFNPPQSPFRNKESRPDKNGGPEANIFTEPILSHFSSHNPTVLYHMFSFMAWPQKYEELLQKYNLKVVWKSSEGIHKIRKQNYDQMEQNLSEYILEHWKKGRARLQYKDEIFYVPIVVNRIEPK